MTTAPDETAPPLTLEALLIRFRGRTVHDFLREHETPLLLHESAPDPELSGEAFGTLVLDRAAVAAAIADHLVIPLRKVPGRNPFEAMITIGRAANNDIVIPFVCVSKFHAYVRRDPFSRAELLFDAGSSNGTFLDGEQLDPESGRP